MHSTLLLQMQHTPQMTNQAKPSVMELLTTRLLSKVFCTSFSATQHALSILNDWHTRTVIPRHASLYTVTRNLMWSITLIKCARQNPCAVTTLPKHINNAVHDLSKGLQLPIKPLSGTLCSYAVGMLTIHPPAA